MRSAVAFVFLTVLSNGTSRSLPEYVFTTFASPALEAVEGVAFGVELRREGGTSGEISVAVKGGEDCGVEGVAVSFSEGQSEVTQELVAEDNLVFEVRFGLVPHHAGPSAHCSPRSPRGRAC